MLNQNKNEISNSAMAISGVAEALNVNAILLSASVLDPIPALLLC